MPTKLAIKTEKTKQMSNFLTEVELQAYYKEKLCKKEKGELLRYLMIEFDYNYHSLQRKLVGKDSMNKRDIILIGETIRNESWKA